MNLIDSLIELSHRYGTCDYVQAGGGNASAKDPSTLWIKASGTLLAAATRETLVALDREKLARVFEVDSAAQPAAREAAVKDLMYAAVVAGTGRPSVEAPLHTSLDATFVVHTHPAMVGGLLCSQQAKDACAELFPEACWIDYTAPGFITSLRVREAVSAYRKAHSREPEAIFQGNHGLIIAGETPAEVDAVHDEIFRRLHNRYAADGIDTTLKIAPAPDADTAATMHRTLQDLLGDDAAGFAAAGAFDVAPGPLSPDHIVYMKAHVLTGAPTREAIEAFTATHGYSPRIITCEQGVFAVGATQAQADDALTLAKDGALVCQLAAAFGGPRYLDNDQCAFIDNWEVESYRRKLAAEKQND